MSLLVQLVRMPLLLLFLLLQCFEINTQAGALLLGREQGLNQVVLVQVARPTEEPKIGIVLGLERSTECVSAPG